MIDVAWMAKAKCRDSDPQAYDLPNSRDMNALPGQSRAKEIDEYCKAQCDGCPVMRACAKDALEAPWLATSVIRAGTGHNGQRRSKTRALAQWRAIVNE